MTSRHIIAARLCNTMAREGAPFFKQLIDHSPPHPLPRKALLPAPSRCMPWGAGENAAAAPELSQCCTCGSGDERRRIRAPAVADDSGHVMMTSRASCGVTRRDTSGPESGSHFFEHVYDAARTVSKRRPGTFVAAKGVAELWRRCIIGAEFLCSRAKRPAEIRSVDFAVGTDDVLLYVLM